MITLHDFVSNTTTVKVISEGEGVKIWPKFDFVICERSLSMIVRIDTIVMS